MMCPRPYWGAYSAAQTLAGFKGGGCFTAENEGFRQDGEGRREEKGRSDVSSYLKVL